MNDDDSPPMAKLDTYVTYHNDYLGVIGSNEPLSANWPWWLCIVICEVIEPHILRN
jgi:hypothetical protein